MFDADAEKQMVPSRIGPPSAFLLSALIHLSQKDSYSKISDLHIKQLSEKEHIEILDVAIKNDLIKPFSYVYYKRG